MAGRLPLRSGNTASRRHRIRRLLEGETLRRAQQMSTGGPAALFADLHPDVSHDGDILSIAHVYFAAERRLEAGNGLALVPSVFAWPGPYSQTSPPCHPACPTRRPTSAPFGNTRPQSPAPWQPSSAKPAPRFSPNWSTRPRDGPGSPPDHVRTQRLPVAHRLARRRKAGRTSLGPGGQPRAHGGRRRSAGVA